MEMRSKLIDYLERIEWENGRKCREFFADHRDKITKAPGSTVKHQAWQGGYADHLTEIMNIAEKTYFGMGREFPFSLSDVFLILFLHDLEKPWKYSWTDVEKDEVRSYPDYKDFILSKVREYGIELSEEHLNALKYVHGEGEDYDPNVRVQLPLAAFVHICDTMSARVFFDYPKVGSRSVDGRMDNEPNVCDGKPVVGTRWRHCKSKGGDDHTYEVVGIARHSETDEELVVYRPLYEVSPDNWVHGFDFAVRPLSMWFDPIEWNGVITPRFVPA